MYYLVNDDRPDRPRRFCWECGSDDTPRTEPNCVSCGADLSPRRFLASVRWDPAGFEPFAAYFDRQFDHPGIIAPVDMFYQDGALFSVTPWNGERLLVDEGSPLPLPRILDLAQRTTGILAFLSHNGIAIDNLACSHFLVGRDEEVLLFDPDVAGVWDGPVPPEELGGVIRRLGWILRRFTSVTQPELHDFFLQAEEGAFATPLEFGRALEQVTSRDLGPVPEVNGAMSDVGLIRTLNEDNWGWTRIRDHVNLFAVADGMGGHEAGEVASKIAIETLCHQTRERLAGVEPVTLERLENTLEESFQSANNAIKDHSETLGNDMGTTMVAALVYDSRTHPGPPGPDEHCIAFIANVGDSRAYLLRQEVLHQVTRDHSLVARMVEQNRITREEARTHPHSNILLRTVGTERDVDIDIFSVELEPGDRLLLCSDGLWGEVEDEDLEAILNHYEEPRVACRELVRAAHHGGGRDNITVVIVGVPE